MNELRKVVIYIIEMLLDKIKEENLLKSADIQSFITDEFTIEMFDKAQELKIHDFQITALEEAFKKEFSSKWISNDAYVLFTLQKHTHFTTHEVKLLQEEFKKFLVGNDEGINKEQFKQMIYQIYPIEKEQQAYLESLDFVKMFDVFDLDDTGYLDFKYFST